MTTKKNEPTKPTLDLPSRPASKVEAGLAGETKPEQRANTDAPSAEGKAAAVKDDTKDDSAEAKRDRAIRAMVEAGLSQEFAEAAFVLKEENASPADVAEAVGEADEHAKDYGAPLCPHGCHGPSWDKVPANLDAVGCEHGSYARKPADKK